MGGVAAVCLPAGLGSPSPSKGPSGRKVFVAQDDKDDKDNKDDVHEHPFSAVLDPSAASLRSIPGPPTATPPVLHKPRISNATATTASQSAASTPRHSGTGSGTGFSIFARSSSGTGTVQGSARSRRSSRQETTTTAADAEGGIGAGAEDEEMLLALPEPLELTVLRVPLLQRHPFQDFRFGRKLGEGSFSVVFQATPMRPLRSQRPSRGSLSTETDTATDTHTQAHTQQGEEEEEREELRAVAIKEVDVRRLTTQQLADVHIEMNLLSQLSHPHIVSLQSVYISGDKRFLVLEHLSGGDLLSAVSRREFFTEPEARYVFTQIADALVYLHERGVVHRDIKPENIILTYKDARSLKQASKSSQGFRSCNTQEDPEEGMRGLQVKLVDFGFATMDSERERELVTLREKSQRMRADAVLRGSPSFSFRKNIQGVLMNNSNTNNTNTLTPKERENETAAVKERERRRSRYLCGTPGYMAPEILQQRLYSTKSDCWALGVVLYILLSGLMPFPTDKDGEKFVLAGMFNFPECRFLTVSGAATDLVCRLLNTDTHMRLSAKDALAHRWLRSPVLSAPPNSADCSLSYSLSLQPSHSLAHSLCGDEIERDGNIRDQKRELSAALAPLRVINAQRSALAQLVSTFSLSAPLRHSLTQQSAKSPQPTLLTAEIGVPHTLTEKKSGTRRRGERGRRASDPSLYLDSLPQKTQTHTPQTHKAHAPKVEEGAEESEKDSSSSESESDGESVAEMRTPALPVRDSRTRPRRHSVE